MLLQNLNLYGQAAYIAQNIAIIVIGIILSRWFPRGALRKLAFLFGFILSPAFLLYNTLGFGFSPAPAVTVPTSVVTTPTVVSSVAQSTEDDGTNSNANSEVSVSTDSTATRDTSASSTPDSQTEGRITANKLNIRRGPSVDYAVISQGQSGTRLIILGRDGSATWWLVELPDGTTGWVNQRYVDVSGCTECVPIVVPSPVPVKKIDSTATPEPSQPVAQEPVLASNRTGFSGEQGANGWKYLVESSRNSGVWQTMVFDGTCYRSGNWEQDVRICAEGEVHPGQSTRIAYEWRPSVPNSVAVTVHAHKIDTSCGDGIWIGTDLARDGRGIEQELGSFRIGGSDNRGDTQTYTVAVDPDNLIYVIVDIHGDSTCDLTRVFIDIQ